MCLKPSLVNIFCDAVFWGPTRANVSISLFASILHIAMATRLPIPLRMNFSWTWRAPRGPACNRRHQPINSFLSSKAPIFGFISIRRLTKKSEPTCLFGQTSLTSSASSADKGFRVTLLGALQNKHESQQSTLSSQTPDSQQTNELTTLFSSSLPLWRENTSL